MMQKININKWHILPGFFIGLFFFIVYNLNLFIKWERMFHNSLVVKNNYKINQKKIRKDLNYIVIFSSSLKKMEQEYNMGWPWRRKYYGKLVDFLSKAGAKSIIFDFFFSEKSVYNISEKPPFYKVNDDLEFADSLKKKKNITIGFLAKDQKINFNLKSEPFYKSRLSSYLKINKQSVGLNISKKIILPIKILRKSVTKIGYIGVEPDEDGIYRRISAGVIHAGRFYPNLALASYLDLFSIKKLELNGSILKAGKLRIPLDSQGNIRVKYYGDTNVYQDYNIYNLIYFYDKLNEAFRDYKRKYKNINFTFNDILINQKSYAKVTKLNNNIPVIKGKVIKKGSILKAALFYKPGMFKDKIFIICSAAPGLYDTLPNPFSPDEPAAHLHMSLLNNLLANDLITEIDNKWLTGLVMLLLCTLLNFVALRYPLSLISVITCICLFLIVAIANVLFYYANVVLHFLTLLLAIIMALITAIVLKYNQERKQRLLITLWLEHMVKISRLVSNSKDMNELLKMILEKMIKITGARRGVLAVFEQEHKYLNFNTFEGLNQTHEDFPHIKKIIEEVRYSEKNILFSAENISHIKVVHEIKAKSLFCFPLYNEERLIGIIYLDSKVSSLLFQKEDLKLLYAFGNQFSMIIENAYLNKKYKKRKINQVKLEELCKTHDITLREKEMLVLLLKGFSQKEVSKKAYISQGTVKKHIHNIYQKFAIKEKDEIFELFLN